MEIKIEQETKVIRETMCIGSNTYKRYSPYSSDYYNTSRKDGIQRDVNVEYGKLSLLGYKPKIEKSLIGWGCHSVKPSAFRKILKGLKSVDGFTFKTNEECNISIKSLKKVVRIISTRDSISKEELIEKMEIVLKAWTFLYK